jgi:hypothetical protein
MTSTKHQAQSTDKNRDKVNVVDFKDIPDDTVMYCGDIESMPQFGTKDEWLREFAQDATMTSFEAAADFFCEDRYIPWYTATEDVKTVSLVDIVERSSDDTYEDWDDDVLRDLKDDDIVKAGIARINEVFARYPTYWEDKLVRF